jgi:hypothetical protein
MTRIAKKWNRGLGDGLEGSGAFVGFAVPVTITCIVLIGFIIGAYYLYGCTQPSKPCTNYSYQLGILRADEAKCTRWVGMRMSINRSYIPLKPDIVNCTCTDESFGKAER